MAHDMFPLGLGDRDRVESSFGGGIPHGSIVLFEGASGSGKSVFAQRFAYGMSDEGIHTAYISPDMMTKDFIGQMKSMNYDVVPQLLDGRLVFLPVDVDTYEEDRALLDRFTEPSIAWEGDVTIADSLDMILRNDPLFDRMHERGDEDHLMQHVVTHLNEVTTGSKSVILTVNPELLTDRTLQPLRDAADVYLQLEANQIGQEIRKNVIVKRFNAMQAPVDDTIGFQVQQGRGIVIESRTVA